MHSGPFPLLELKFLEKRVAEKCWRGCCREVLGRSIVEKSVGEKYCREECCRDVLEKSIAENCCRGECWREVFERSVVEKCWRRVL